MNPTCPLIARHLSNNSRQGMLLITQEIRGNAPQLVMLGRKPAQPTLWAAPGGHRSSKRLIATNTLHQRAQILDAFARQAGEIRIAHRAAAVIPNKGVGANRHYIFCFFPRRSQR